MAFGTEEKRNASFKHVFNKYSGAHYNATK